MKLTELNLSGARRLPVIYQTEAAECGLAAIAMIADYYGFKTDLGHLRRRFSISMQGMTLKTLMEVAAEIGFSARPLQVSLSHVGHIQVPAILHWDMNHFVVLKAVKKGKYVVHDPALGVCTYDVEEFSKHFTGIALELATTETFAKKKEKSKLGLTELWGRSFGLKRSLLQVLALSCVLQVFVLASPFYLQVAVDEVLTKFDSSLLLVLVFGFAGLTLINFAAHVTRGFVLLYLGSMLSYQMVVNLFRHLIRLPVDFFEKRHIGDITSRFGSMQPIKVMLTEGLAAGLIDGVMALTTLILMFIYSVKLATIALLAWFLYFTVRMVLYQPLRLAQENLIRLQAKEQSTFIETVSGITYLKLFGAEHERENLWKNKYAKAMNAKARHERLNIWFKSANIGIFGIEYIVIVYVAISMVLAGDFSIGMIFAFLAYKHNFTEKASALVEQAIEFRMLSLHLERVADIAHTEKEVLESPGIAQVDIQPISGSLEAKNIHYRYSFDSPDILRGVDLSIKAGEFVAITGLSGNGKTTLLKILTGLFQPSAGEVLIDGVSISSYGLAAYRKQIGVIMQDGDLFAGSIAENISFFSPVIDMERVVAVAKTAMIHDEIMRMPLKYESLVGDMGSALSGGQKQRVMLASALYRKPKILFMDEGTAHLDILTEGQVNQSIAALGITRVVVAHRSETIRLAERVVTIDDGIAAEQSGPYVQPVKLEDSRSNAGNKGRVL